MKETKIQEAHKDRLAICKDLAKKGASRSEIAEVLNVSYSTVIRYLRELGLSKDIAHKKQKKELQLLEAEEEMVRLYVDEELSMEAIGKIIGCTGTRVAKALKKRGVKTRKPATIRYQYIDKVAEMYKSGAKIAEISRELKISRSTVEVLLAEAGLKHQVSDFTTPVFTWDEDNTFCYDYASDCQYYHNGHCKMLTNTIFKDRFGQREICNYYKRKRK